MFRLKHFVASDGQVNNSCQTGHHLCFQRQVEVDTGYFWSVCFQSSLCLWAQGPAAAYQTLHTDKATLCFFHGHRDRLLMRLQSESSDLTLWLWSLVSPHFVRKREMLCSRCCKELKGLLVVYGFSEFETNTLMLSVTFTAPEKLWLFEDSKMCFSFLHVLKCIIFQNIYNLKHIRYTCITNKLWSQT